MAIVAEQWRDVKGFEGIYQVSDLGRIKSLARTIEQDGRYGERVLHAVRERILSPGLHNAGYQTVTLCGPDGKRSCRTVHAIVADSFLGPRPSRYDVNHKNGDKHDNRPENLEYCSRKANMDHAKATGIWNNTGERNGQATITNDTVLQIVEDLKTMAPGLVADKHRVDKRVIYRIRSGVKWSRVTGIQYVRKGKNTGRKLTADDVRCIKAMPFRNAVMAERFGVSTGLVEQIRYGKAWKHVQLESPAVESIHA